MPVYARNRGVPRPESETKSKFCITTKDNASVNGPNNVLRNLCGYLHGLETLRQRLENTEATSNSNDDVYRVIADDYADDASFIVLGLTSSGYKEKWEMVQKEQIYRVHGQLTKQCYNEEKSIAKLIRLLRKDHRKDPTFFCRVNLLQHFMTMTARWKFLNGTKMMIWKECDDLKSNDNPCLTDYSNIEQLFGSEDEVKLNEVPSDVAVPKRWIYTDKKNSKWIRQ
ncbi:uncharacterized protein [Argopecten irradians]|uniref:uncharacterized protein n=1 Tax=Argopecten irradians TaxID=31199 RepID=UPI0037183CEA